MEVEKVPSPRGARKHRILSRRVVHARRVSDDILIDLFPPHSKIFIFTREGGETCLLSLFKCGPTRAKRAIGRLVLLRFIVVLTKSLFKRKKRKRKRRKPRRKHGNEESQKAQTRCESEERKRRTKRRPKEHKKHTSSRGKTRECRTCSCIITIALKMLRRRRRKRKRKNPTPLPRGKNHPPKETKTQRKRKILRAFEKRSANTGSDGNAFV